MSHHPTMTSIKNTWINALYLTKPVGLAFVVLTAGTIIKATAASQTVKPIILASSSGVNGIATAGTNIDILQSQPLYKPVYDEASSNDSASKPATDKRTALKMQTKVYQILPNGEQADVSIEAIENAPVGSVLEYHITYQNVASHHIASVNARASIPEGIELLNDGNTNPSSFEASVDGSKFYRFPIKARTKAGVLPIAMIHYKALQWSLEDIGKNEVRTVVFRAKKIK